MILLLFVSYLYMLPILLIVGFWIQSIGHEDVLFSLIPKGFVRVKSLLIINLKNGYIVFFSPFLLLPYEGSEAALLAVFSRILFVTRSYLGKRSDPVDKFYYFFLLYFATHRDLISVAVSIPPFQACFSFIHTLLFPPIAWIL